MKSFRSHCLQDHPEYEIIFGVSDAADPALPLVERLRSEFPEKSIRWIVCSKSLGANTKVSNLAQMLPEAKYDNVLVNDSDIRVPEDYVARVTAPLLDPKIGLVTCLYRGVASRTLGSRLESLGLSTDFSAECWLRRPSKAVSASGSAPPSPFDGPIFMAIGGFEALVDYLADDYEIGCRLPRKD